VARGGGWIGLVVATLAAAWEAYNQQTMTPLPIYVGLGTSSFALVVGVVAMWADARRGRR